MDSMLHETPFSGEPPHRAENALDPGDLRLIDWMLSLSPRERLRVAQGFVTSMRALQNGRRD